MKPIKPMTVTRALQILRGAHTTKQTIYAMRRIIGSRVDYDKHPDTRLAFDTVVHAIESSEKKLISDALTEINLAFGWEPDA